MQESQSQRSSQEIFCDRDFMTLVKVQQGLNDAKKVEEHCSRTARIFHA